LKRKKIVFKKSSLRNSIAEIIVDLPILIVLAYRPPELLRLQAPCIEALAHFMRVELAPLTDAEAAQTIRAKLAQLLPERKGAATPALITRITAKAQGNPFYVEELLNYLRDRGIDPQDTAAIAQAVRLRQGHRGATALSSRLRNHSGQCLSGDNGIIYH
jgi:hypothetical protein